MQEQSKTAIQQLSVIELKDFVVNQLDESKSHEIKEIEVGHKSSIADFMIIASGTSNRHVKSIATLLVKELKAKKINLIGVEGEDAAEWILIDIGDVVVHVMQPKIRDYYQLEKLWE